MASVAPQPKSVEIPLDVVERMLTALHQSHREALGKAEMRVVLYRQALEDAGIHPPDASGEELLAMWRDAAAVISTASEFVHHLGTSRELLDERWPEYDPWKLPFARRWRE